MSASGEAPRRTIVFPAQVHRCTGGLWPNPAGRASIAGWQIENLAVVAAGRHRPEAGVRATVLLCSAFAHLRVFIPPATTVQTTVYSHFVPQP
jgi:hypothetical protein